MGADTKTELSSEVMIETMRENETLRDNADRKERKRENLEKEEILGISSRRRAGAGITQCHIPKKELFKKKCQVSHKGQFKN